MFPRKGTKIAESPHREEYERLLIEGKMTLDELSAFAKSKGENISRQAFHAYRHKHLKPIQRALETIKRSEYYVDEKVRQELDILETIEKNLRKCMYLSEVASKAPLTPANLSAIASLQREIRLGLEMISKTRGKMGFGIEKKTEQDIISIIVEALKDIPKEYQQIVIARLKGLT